MRDPTRIAETLNRVILQAKRASAPAQINIPRDFLTQIIDIEMPKIVELIDKVIQNVNNEAVLDAVRQEVNALMGHRPLFAW